MDDQNSLENSRTSYLNDLLRTYMSEIPKSEGSRTDEIQLIARSLTNLEERLKIYLSSKDEGEERRQYIHRAESQENYLMQIFKNRNQNVYGTGGPNIFIHQDVLTKTLPLVLKDVNLDGTTIMDRLIQDEVMTDDERISIVQESTPRRRKEAFIGLMRGKLSLKSLRETFIPAVEVDHPEVATKIKKICDDMLDNPPSYPQCVVCSVKDAVQVHILAQPLLKDNVITSGIYEELRSRNNSNSEKWTRLCESISDHSQIIAALESHFPQFFSLLHQNDVKDMQCFCEKFEDDSSVSSNTNAYFDAGNCLLGDLDSVINGDSTYKKDAYGIGGNQNQPTPSGMQRAQITLILDPSGPDYNLLIKPARPFSMYPTASSGSTTFQQLGQGNWLRTDIPPPSTPFAASAPHGFPSTPTPYPSKPPDPSWNRKARSPAWRTMYRNPQSSIKMKDPMAAYFEPQTTSTLRPPSTSTLKPPTTSTLKPQTASTLEPVTASMLAAASPQEQKQMLGERLYPKIKTLDSDQARKITRMLLMMDNSELLHMLENHEALISKVDEAKAVLHYHKAKDTTAKEKD